MHELVIDRAVWLRGDPDSWLLRTGDGRMCCIGIYLAACGVSKKRLTDVAIPERVKGHFPARARWLLHDAGQASDQLVEVNDTIKMPSRTREAGIRKVFKQAGVLVRFVGK